MKALVYHGPNEKSWDDVPDPKVIDPTDAVVVVDATTICGSDLHILKGDLPEVTPGRILGHEAVGTVEKVGTAVRNFKAGDRVLVSCISACGKCRFCRESRFGQCLDGGGWILGHNIDGTQAEKVRVPFADTSAYPVPAGITDDEFLMLADILPTAYEVGVLNGGVSPGDVVAIVGAGPIGLSAITGALLFSPSHIIAIDLADSRLEAAKQFGADVTVNNGREDPRGDHQETHRRPGCRRGHRSGRHARDLRTGHRAHPARRPRGQHRRPRQAGRAAPRDPVDSRRDDHNRSRRYLLHTDAQSPDGDPATATRHALSPITSPSTSSSRPTTCSPTRQRPAPSRSYSPVHPKRIPRHS